MVGNRNTCSKNNWAALLWLGIGDFPCFKTSAYAANNKLLCGDLRVTVLSGTLWQTVPTLLPAQESKPLCWVPEARERLQGVMASNAGVLTLPTWIRWFWLFQTTSCLHFHRQTDYDHVTEGLWNPLQLLHKSPSRSSLQVRPVSVVQSKWTSKFTRVLT